MDSYKNQEQMHDDFAFEMGEKNVEEYSIQQNSYLNDSIRINRSFSEDMLDDSNRNPIITPIVTEKQAKRLVERFNAAKNRIKKEFNADGAEDQYLKNVYAMYESSIRDAMNCVFVNENQDLMAKLTKAYQEINAAKFKDTTTNKLKDEMSELQELAEVNAETTTVSYEKGNLLTSEQVQKITEIDQWLMHKLDSTRSKDSKADYLMHFLSYSPAERNFVYHILSSGRVSNCDNSDCEMIYQGYAPKLEVFKESLLASRKNFFRRIFTKTVSWNKLEEAERAIPMFRQYTLTKNEAKVKEGKVENKKLEEDKKNQIIDESQELIIEESSQQIDDENPPQDISDSVLLARQAKVRIAALNYKDAKGAEKVQLAKTLQEELKNALQATGEEVKEAQEYLKKQKSDSGVAKTAIGLTLKGIPKVTQIDVAAKNVLTIKQAGVLGTDVSKKVTEYQSKILNNTSSLFIVATGCVSLIGAALAIKNTVKIIKEREQYSGLENAQKAMETVSSFAGVAAGVEASVAVLAGGIAKNFKDAALAGQNVESNIDKAMKIGAVAQKTATAISYTTLVLNGATLVKDVVATVNTEKKAEHFKSAKAVLTSKKKINSDKKKDEKEQLKEKVDERRKQLLVRMSERRIKKERVTNGLAITSSTMNTIGAVSTLAGGVGLAALFGFMGFAVGTTKDIVGAVYNKKNKMDFVDKCINTHSKDLLLLYECIRKEDKTL